MVITKEEIEERIPPRPLTNQDFRKFVILFSIGVILMIGFASVMNKLAPVNTYEEIIDVCNDEYYCRVGITALNFCAIIFLLTGIILMVISLPWDKKVKKCKCEKCEGDKK